MLSSHGNLKQGLLFNDNIALQKKKKRSEGRLAGEYCRCGVSYGQGAKSTVSCGLREWSSALIHGGRCGKVSEGDGRWKARKTKTMSIR